MKSNKKYFTMFRFIFFGDPDKTVGYSKQVAEAVSDKQAKYLVGILNKGRKASIR